MWARKDSNLRQGVYKTPVLAAELLAHAGIIPLKIPVVMEKRIFCPIALIHGKLSDIIALWLRQNRADGKNLNAKETWVLQHLRNP